ncbi:type I restriction endonuclease subunit R, EcoR124 family [Exiguobacterium sp. SH0S1]|uniref:type I restriction endonuclease subunit R, EcoR124 family n=1 Tax=Exiguobacterium sp. SH0S1 TaxID=2510949 RepID=UPI001F1C5C7E|nr:hypothetical protein [Exiguobacterium sp. SH0S1]
MKTIEDFVGSYNKVIGSLLEESGTGDEDTDGTPDSSEIEFYGDNAARFYDVDSSYIDKLLGTCSANNADVRSKIEKTLQKLNKSEVVKEVYRSILNTIDSGEIEEDDIFACL